MVGSILANQEASKLPQVQKFGFIIAENRKALTQLQLIYPAGTKILIDFENELEIHKKERMEAIPIPIRVETVTKILQELSLTRDKLADHIGLLMQRKEEIEKQMDTDSQAHANRSTHARVFGKPRAACSIREARSVNRLASYPHPGKEVDAKSKTFYYKGLLVHLHLLSHMAPSHEEAHATSAHHSFHKSD